MVKVAIINGTNNETSRINAIQQFIEQRVDDVTTIEVYKLPAQALITGDYTNAEIQAANAELAKADVVFVLTPVYKASYTGILKTYLDLLPQKGLENKTIIPVAVGGSAHHLLAIEYALKPVLSVLGATNILQGVYIVDQAIERTAQGFVIQEAERTRLEVQLAKVVPVPV